MSNHRKTPDPKEMAARIIEETKREQAGTALTDALPPFPDHQRPPAPERLVRDLGLPRDVELPGTTQAVSRADFDALEAGASVDHPLAQLAGAVDLEGMVSDLEGMVDKFEDGLREIGALPEGVDLDAALYGSERKPMTWGATVSGPLAAPWRTMSAAELADYFDNDPERLLDVLRCCAAATVRAVSRWVPPSVWIRTGDLTEEQLSEFREAMAEMKRNPPPIVAAPRAYTSDLLEPPVNDARVPEESITRAEVEQGLRETAEGRLNREEKDYRGWLFSVLGWMERNGEEVFNRADVEAIRLRRLREDNLQDRLAEESAAAERYADRCDALEHELAERSDEGES